MVQITATRLLMALTVTLSLALAPLRAAADDAAMIVGVGAYDLLPDIAGVRGLTDLRRGLKRQGYADLGTWGPRNGLRDPSRLSGIVDAAAQSDRVVIVLAGHFATDGSRAWLLLENARAPDLMSVGQNGLSVDSLIRVASGARRGGLVFLAESEDDRRAAGKLDRYLRVGVGRPDRRDGVTVISGGLGDIERLITRMIADPTRNFRDQIVGNPAFHIIGRSTDRVALASGSRSSGSGATSGPEAVERALNLSRDERRAVQQDLALLGYDPRGIDGIFGAGTRTALREWQKDAGQPQTGFLNARILRDIEAAAGRVEQESKATRARDDAAYTKAARTNTIGAYRGYLRSYPEGVHVKTARRKIAQLKTADADNAAWNIAREADTAREMRRYLDAFPDGLHADEAKSRRASLIAASNARQQALEDELLTGPLDRARIEFLLYSMQIKPGPTDGLFTAETRTALRAFQKQHDLPLTGYVNRRTLNKLVELGLKR